MSTLIPPDDESPPSLFLLFCHWLWFCQWYPNFKKISFLCLRFPRGHRQQCTGYSLDSPVPLSFRQQVPVRGRDASSLTPCPTGKPGKCRTTQSEPTSGRTVFWVESLCSTSLPHSGYVGGSPSPACSVSGGLASSPQTGLMAHKNYQTWLCDSVRLASSQVQGRSVHYCAEPGCSRLANGDCGPTGKGCDRAGPSS